MPCLKNSNVYCSILLFSDKEFRTVKWISISEQNGLLSFNQCKVLGIFCLLIQNLTNPLSLARCIEIMVSNFG